MAANLLAILQPGGSDGHCDITKLFMRGTFTFGFGLAAACMRYLATQCLVGNKHKFPLLGRLQSGFSFA